MRGTPDEEGFEIPGFTPTMEIKGEVGGDEWRWLFRNLLELRDMEPLLQPGDSGTFTYKLTVDDHE